MFELTFLIPLLIILALIWWGFSPYFQWKKVCNQPIRNTFVIITQEGRQSVKEYTEKKEKENNRVQYSVVIPAYNEEKRLPNMIPKTIEHFERMSCKYEIIVANNGSTDKTTDITLQYSQYKGKKIDIKVLEFDLDQGKGEAVRLGCSVSNGEVILMADADGATDISEFEKLVHKLREIEKDGHGIAAGSRRVADGNVVQERLGYRLFLSHCSNFVVQNICGVKMEDTQCGFKLFTRRTALALFRPLHIRKWAFDVELFVIANKMKIPYVEVPVNYFDQSGSKLNIVTDSLQMARDFILIRLFYILKIWRITHTDRIWETLVPSSSRENGKKFL